MEDVINFYISVVLLRLEIFYRATHLHIRYSNFTFCAILTAQKMKFSIKDFFSKCDQI